MTLESDAMAHFCNEFVHLADDFDSDGIQDSMLGLDGQINLIDPSFS